MTEKSSKNLGFLAVGSLFLVALGTQLNLISIDESINDVNDSAFEKVEIVVNDEITDDSYNFQLEIVGSASASTSFKEFSESIENIIPGITMNDKVNITLGIIANMKDSGDYSDDYVDKIFKLYINDLLVGYSTVDDMITNGFPSNEKSLDNYIDELNKSGISLEIFNGLSE